MILEWIGAIVLLVVVLPIVIFLLQGVYTSANSIVPSAQSIANSARAGSADLDATALLLTTQQQVKQTVEVVAGYGGSLDTIVDDA